MPKVSVIIPIYNNEKYIESCFDSLVAQTLDDIQVIMIDDGSKDHTAEICKKYQSLYPNFEYYYKENGGSASARNVGLNHARGEYIGFVDSDDYVEVDMFEKMYAAATEHKADIVFNVMRRPEAESRYPFTWPKPGYYDRKAMETEIFPELFPHPNKKGTFRSFDWGNWSKLIRSDIVKENDIHYYDKTRRCEDLAFMFECTIHANSYYIMEPELLYHYVSSENSKTRNYTKNMWANIKKMMIYLESVNQKYDFYDFSEAIKYCVLYFACECVRNEAYSNKNGDHIQKIQEILDDNYLKDRLYLTGQGIYNKKYSSLFHTMSTANAEKVYHNLKMFEFKKKYVAPIIRKLRK